MYREIPAYLASEILSLARESASPAESLSDAVLAIQRSKLVDAAVVLRADHGEWVEVAIDPVELPDGKYSALSTQLSEGAIFKNLVMSDKYRERLQ